MPRGWRGWCRRQATPRRRRPAPFREVPAGNFPRDPRLPDSGSASPRAPCPRHPAPPFQPDSRASQNRRDGPHVSSAPVVCGMRAAQAGVPGARSSRDISDEDGTPCLLSPTTKAAPPAPGSRSCPAPRGRRQPTRPSARPWPADNPRRQPRGEPYRREPAPAQRRPPAPGKPGQPTGSPQTASPVDAGGKLAGAPLAPYRPGVARGSRPVKAARRSQSSAPGAGDTSAPNGAPGPARLRY